VRDVTAAETVDVAKARTIAESFILMFTDIASLFVVSIVDCVVVRCELCE
jgi:hypothetical protein